MNEIVEKNITCPPLELPYDVSNRKSSKAVCWLMQRNGLEDPEKSVLYETNKLLEEYGGYVPPLSIEKIASLRRIIRIEEVSMDSFADLLIPLDGGFVLKVNNTLPSQYKRFWSAHGISHTFFYDMKLPRPTTHVDDTAPLYRDFMLEDLCHIAACEMLAPLPIFKKELNKIMNSDSTQDVVAELADVFMVPKEVIEHRMVYAKRVDER